ncbi:MAG: hypothetical protein EOO05_17935 [Chitinophagaceae bacterium]|nr:MAG: hypothetical protein EOO05_17935 [Chitinophagaceae bacterium]
MPLLLMLMYFPSLLVKENYESARTRLVLTVAVATWAVVLLSRWRAGGLLAGAPFLFLVFWLVAMGRSNYNKGFRKPLEAEYAAARKLFDSTYDRTTNSFVFHAPSEDQFALQYDRQRSWDEYSVPSLFFPWVPEPFFKQLLYERTGDRRLADSLQVSVLPGPPAYNRR